MLLTEKIRLSVSSCLLGEAVRWNGDHKRDRYLTDVLSDYFEWVPLCPEVEIGMGVPRETVHLRRFPLISVEEEGRLQNPKLRENFIERIFAYRRLQELWQDRFNLRKLIAFHTRHKFLLPAHNRRHYDSLGRLVAEGKQLRPSDLRMQYSRLFMETLACPASPKRHADVMHHMMRFLKNSLDRGESGRLTECDR